MTPFDDDLSDTGRMAAAFADELARLRDGLSGASQETLRLERGFSGGLRRAIDGLLLDGDRLSDALRNVARSMADTIYAAAMKPVTDRLGGLLAQGVGTAMQALSPFASGGSFSQGRVMPFAKGGIVSQATAFPMRGGTGLMGEAGPEAIMPLARDASGRLGVRAEGAGASRPVQVTIHVTTPDVAGFARSQGQIAAEMGRLLARGARNR
jgi:phage-related minor tail protein